jgi:hypothetical protein
MESRRPIRLEYHAVDFRSRQSAVWAIERPSPQRARPDPQRIWPWGMKRTLLIANFGGAARLLLHDDRLPGRWR